jgi:hypothetical protein
MARGNAKSICPLWGWESLINWLQQGEPEADRWAQLHGGHSDGRPREKACRDNLQRLCESLAFRYDPEGSREEGGEVTNDESRNGQGFHQESA